MRAPSGRTPSARVARLVGRVVRGLLAVTLLAALVAGLPWALIYGVGWPLPDHLPSLDEIGSVLMAPMSSRFLLDAIACLAWLLWLVFVLDVAVCALEVARGARWPELRGRRGLVRRVAAVLVGALLVAVLGRTATAAPLTSGDAARPVGHALVVATAPVSTTPLVGVHSGILPSQLAAEPGIEWVRAPENGVHDSLWRIAQRCLGDGDRWPEIWALNEGSSQPGGRILSNPSLVHPGDTLHLPITAPSSPPPAPPPKSTPPTTPQPSTPATPIPSTPQAPPAATGTNSPHSATREPSVSWGPELFVGLGLAAAISSTLLIARRRHNSRYRPGSGDRGNLPVTPVVYRLRLAHLRAEQDDTEFDLNEDSTDDDREQRREGPPPPLVVGAPQNGSSSPSALAPGLGVRDGREIALDLAVARGVGLVGAGAPAAARALLIAALTASTDQRAPSAGVTVVVPADDLAAVLGHGAAQAHLPAAVRVVADVGEALDMLEAQTLVRAASGRQRNTEPGPWPALVLAARPPQYHQRLQAILDNGAPFGVLGILLSQWQPGVTCYVREDGTLSATSPGPGEALRGTRMFRLGDDDTAELLTLLHQADPDEADRDQMGAPPVPAPRIRPMPFTDNPAHDDVELEVAAAVQDPAPADTEVEVRGPGRASAPSVQPGPPAAMRQQLPTPQAGDHDELDREVSGEPEPTADKTTTAAEPLPPAAGGGEVAPASVPITITVLGGLRVFWNPGPDISTSASDTAPENQGHEITGVLQPQTKELLVLLALHPGGTSRETLVSALWGQDPPARPTNALHTALSRMRRALAAATDGAVTEVASVDNGRYRLDPEKVYVDYWRFAEAVAARRVATTDNARVDAYRDVVNSYGGALAEGMSNEWIEPAREAIRRDAIDAVAALARALVDSDPQQTLDLLEIARAFDPHNEALYRDIMRLQERLEQHDAIPRTLTLLTTRLAEINEAPSDHTLALAARLRQRQETSPPSPAQPADQDAAQPQPHSRSRRSQRRGGPHSSASPAPRGSLP